MRSFLLTLLLAASVAAQGGVPNQTLYFSTRFAETPASGRGGNIADATPTCGNPANPQPGFGAGFVIESAVSNSPGFNCVVPGVPNITEFGTNPPVETTDFVEIANFPQLNLLIGDLDGDGTTHEASNFRGIDAVYIPSAASDRHNSINEVFVSSFSDSSGSQGFYSGQITEADMVLFPSATNAYPLAQAPQPLVYFIRQADWETLFQLAPGSGSGIDVNAFAVDRTTGDIYASFDSRIRGVTVVDGGGASSVVDLDRGDIIRVPGPNTLLGLQSGYTASGPYGVVTNPVAGSVELIATVTEVVGLVGNAGCSISGTGNNVYGLEIDGDITSGVFMGQNGHTSPNLFFTVDNRGGSSGSTQNACATAVYSTRDTGSGPGSYAVINGVTMDRPTAAGIADVSFNQNFFAGPLDGIAIVENPGYEPRTERNIHLDSFPTNGTVSSSLFNGTLTGYVSGAKSSGATIAIFAKIKAVSAGGFAERWNATNLGVSGYDQLFVDPFGIAEPCADIVPTSFVPFCQFPAAQALFTSGLNPIVALVDPVNGAVNGDSCFDLDLSNLVNSPAPGNVMIVFQALDLGTLELSNPVSFQLD